TSVTCVPLPDLFREFFLRQLEQAYAREASRQVRRAAYQQTFVLGCYHGAYLEGAREAQVVRAEQRSSCLVVKQQRDLLRSGVACIDECLGTVNNGSEDLHRGVGYEFGKRVPGIVDRRSHAVRWQ